MKPLDFEDTVSIVLRIGVLSSIIFVLAGVALIFITGKADGFTLSELSNLTSPSSTQLNSSMLHPSAIFNGVMNLDGAYFIALGLWVLVFTPISVVVISLVEFLRLHNYRYVLMSLIVLVNLMVAMFIIR